MQAAIYGLEGLELTASERDFFHKIRIRPGFILFKRNCETRDQVLALTNSLRELTGRADFADPDRPGGWPRCSDEAA